MKLFPEPTFTTMFLETLWAYCAKMFDYDKFKSDRDAAMLSLDETRIRTVMRDHTDFELPSDPDEFWLAVHKTIIGLKHLPMEFRRSSQQWIQQRGHQAPGL